MTYPRQKDVVPKVQFLGITELKSLSIAVIALDTTVWASLAILRVAVVTLGASLCKDCTIPLPPPTPGGVRPRGERLVELN